MRPGASLRRWATGWPETSDQKIRVIETVVFLISGLSRCNFPHTDLEGEHRVLKRVKIQITGLQSLIEQVGAVVRENRALAEQDLRDSAVQTRRPR